MSKKKTKQKQQASGIKTWQKIAAVIIILIFGAFVVFNNLLKEEPVQRRYEFTKEGELVFYDTLGNAKKSIDIEIADNDYERELGLMFRESMSENQGMLFIFPYQSMQSFWMKNTRISLDILFVDKQKKIVTIHKGTDIYSKQSYPSTQPAIYVVEVIAGFTDKYNITVGDSIDWSVSNFRM